VRHPRLALVLVVVCAAMAVAPAVGRGRQLNTPTFDDLFAAYTKGDRDIVATTLADTSAFLFFEGNLKEGLAHATPLTKPATPARPWSPIRQAFLLELAIVASLHSKTDVLPILSVGRLELIGRETPLGRDAQADAFEKLWHIAAVAVLQRIVMPDAEHVYLDTIERRYLAPHAVAGTEPALDSRFVLDRAIADEQMIWKSQSLGRSPTTRLTTLVKPSEKSKLSAALAAAIKDCDAAAKFPEVAAEARIRGAALRIEAGQYADALDSLRQFDEAVSDGIQAYWATLLQARALHELKRLPEAESMYRTAATMWPEAQSPLTGGALVLFEMNRRDEAMAAADTARALPSTGADPWWSYMLADARFINRWRDQIRRLLP